MTTNAKRKGNRAESSLVKILNDRFKHLPLEIGRFSRSVGSGNRFGQNVVLSQEAKNVYASDITAPEGFLWSLESKCGYENKVTVGRLLEGPNMTFDGFLEQATKDATHTGRKPALIFRQSRRKPLVFVGIGELPQSIQSRLVYGQWEGTTLDEWLGIIDDSYFFAPPKSQ